MQSAVLGAHASNTTTMANQTKHKTRPAPLPESDLALLSGLPPAQLRAAASKRILEYRLMIEDLTDYIRQLSTIKNSAVPIHARLPPEPLIHMFPTGRADIQLTNPRDTHMGAYSEPHPPSASAPPLSQPPVLMPRRSLTRTPTSSSQQSRATGVQPALQTFCKADEYILDLLRGLKPMPKEDRHKMIKFCHPEANDGNMQQFIERYDKNNEQQRLMRESGVRAIGMKPLPGDSSLFTVRIPNSCYLIRMWDGGMDRFAQYCLDLYDSHRQVPVNLPKGYSLWPAAANIPGAFTVAGPLASWETDMGFAPGSFPEGEEKWSVPEGVYITVKRADRPGEDFTFAVPRRQHADLGAIAQPVRGYAP